MSQEIMGMTGISMWLEDLIHYLNLRSTILPAPHSVEVNVPFWKNDDLDWQCKPESDDMSNTHFLDISETAQILQHHRHHRFFNHTEIDWQFKPNPDDDYHSFHRYFWNSTTNTTGFLTLSTWRPDLVQDLCFSKTSA